MTTTSDREKLLREQFEAHFRGIMPATEVTERMLARRTDDEVYWHPNTHWMWQGFQAGQSAVGVSRDVPRCYEDVMYGKYGQFLAPFLFFMERELIANAGKGDQAGWLQMSADECLLEIYYHLAKLQKSVRTKDISAITENAADVANMSMMLLDIYGGIPASNQQEKG